MCCHCQFSTTNSLPRLPISAAAAGSRMMDKIASATASTSVPSTTVPVTDSITVSGAPDCPATTGTPVADASR